MNLKRDKATWDNGIKSIGKLLSYRLPKIPGKLKILIVYSISFLALAYWQNQPSQYRPLLTAPLSIIQYKKDEFAKFLSPEQSGAIIAYTLGDKSGLSRKTKKGHKNLNLLHLFTPSGIHLSSIAFILLPVIFLLRKLTPMLPCLFFFTLYTLAFMLPGYWSIKRIILLKAFHLFPKELDSFTIFLLAFTFDFFFGTYKYSPLSFIYSFLFLGIIFSMKDFPKISFLYFIFIAQLIICYFQKETLFILSPLLGILLTLLFSFCFPFFFGAIILQPLIPTFLYKIPLQFFLFLVNFFSQFIGIFGGVSPSIPLITISIVVLFSFNNKLKSFLIALCLLIHSNALFNLPKNSLKLFNGEKNRKLEKFKIKKITLHRRGYRVIFTNGIQCKMTLFNNYYRDQCR